MSRRKVSLGPGLVVDLVLVRGLDLQQVEHVGRHVVVQRSGRVGEQQGSTAGNGPDDDEELVVHGQQPEHRSRGRHPAQGGDHTVEILQQFFGEQRAFPSAVLPDDSRSEPVDSHGRERYADSRPVATQISWKPIR